MLCSRSEHASSSVSSGVHALSASHSSSLHLSLSACSAATTDWASVITRVRPSSPASTSFICLGAMVRRHLWPRVHIVAYRVSVWGWCCKYSQFFFSVFFHLNPPSGSNIFFKRFFLYNKLFFNNRLLINTRFLFINALNFFINGGCNFKASTTL